MAKPRVFVSSTYYDLRHIRADMKKFLQQYGFEPVLNETGSIPYHHLQPLDESCMQEAQQCHIFILVIGGRYGSAASDQHHLKHEDEQAQFYNKYISITRKEYRSAYEKTIPIYIFVEKNVFAEYQTWRKNRDNTSVRYAHADHSSIFEFVDEASTHYSNNATFLFDKFDDIVDILKEQWSGLFYNYLTQLQEKNENEKMIDSISKLEAVTNNIHNMLNTVGRKVLGDDEEYESIIKEQARKLVSFYAERIGNDLQFPNVPLSQVKDSELQSVVRALFEEFYDSEAFNQMWEAQNLAENDPTKSQRRERYNKQVHKLQAKVNLVNPTVARMSTKPGLAKTYITEIRPLLNKYPDLRPNFYKDIANTIFQNYSLSSSTIETAASVDKTD